MKRMLIVENDDLFFQLLTKLFKRDFEVDVSVSAEMFYQKFSTVNYDIIIMDITLPGGKSGLGLIKELRAMSRYVNTPIICLTAHAFKRDRELAMEAGADCYIAKPVENDVLKDAVKSLIGG